MHTRKEDFVFITNISGEKIEQFGEAMKMEQQETAWGLRNKMAIQHQHLRLSAK